MKAYLALCRCAAAISWWSDESLHRYLQVYSCVINNCLFEVCTVQQVLRVHAAHEYCTTGVACTHAAHEYCTTGVACTHAAHEYCTTGVACTHAAHEYYTTGVACTHAVHEYCTAGIDCTHAAHEYCTAGVDFKLAVRTPPDDPQQQDRPALTH